jgi:excinuclease ABC, C subunit
MFNIANELKKLPNNPGVYIMKNKDNKIIYIGKAINLKKRVKQYFQKSASHTPKVKQIVKNITSFEYIITDNELEALILECNLIKQNRPKYNILLKDDKTYPYIKINLNEKFPTINIVHKHNKDKAKYFGPYSNATALKNTIKLIYDLWPIRRCKKQLKNNKRPCLNYYIKKCKAPCCKFINEDKYNEMIEQIIDFLHGDSRLIIKDLQEKMKTCANNLEFEKAIELRDKILAVKNVNEKQKIESSSEINRDVIGFSRMKNTGVVKIFFIRNGKIIDQSHFFLNGTENRTRAEIITEFIKQFYSEQNFIPKEIIVSQLIDKNLTEQYFSKLAQKSIKIICPQKGEKYKLLTLASKNANMILERLKNNHESKFQIQFDSLQKILHLETLNKIEAYDISNTQGTNSVGAMISINKNGFDKKNFRRYKIKNVVGPNDYASMQEVIERRMKYNNKPDLLLIDGGRGHVHCVEKILDELKIAIAVCGMVKDDKHKTKSIFFNGNEIYLPNEILHFITRIQDEIHRFAISYHRKLREKSQTLSILDNIKKIGPKRKKILLSHFGSIENIINASVDDLMKVKTINSDIAKNIFDYMQQYRY